MQQDLLHLRVSRNHEEIINTINSMYVDCSPVMLWQNHGKKRVIVYATIDKIEFDRKRIVLLANKQHDFKNFKSDITVYIRGENKSILFKQEQCRFNSKQIALLIPSEVRLYEQRHNPRVKMTQDFELNAYFSKRVGSGSGSQKSFAAKVINLSADGACFEYLQSLGKFFYEGDSIVISHFDHLKFEPSLEAKIVYIQKPSYASDRLRMGIKLDNQLTQDMMSQIIKNHYHSKTIKSVQ